MASIGQSRASAAGVPTSGIEGQRHDRIPSHHHEQSREITVETSISQKMLSAVTGSVLTSLLVTPLDVVRVRLQSQTQSSPSLSSSSAEFARLPPNTGVSTCCREVFWVQNQSQFCVASPSGSAVAIPNDVLISECAAEETQRRTINSTFDGLRKIARNEGLTTLWRGLSPTLLMAVPANVIYFAGYDWMRTNDKSYVKTQISEAYAPLVAGSIARVLAAVAVSPIEMLRTRMQASRSSSTGAVLSETVTGLREMVSTDGYRSLWRGLGLTFWRDVPFSALYWWGYEYGRQALHERRERRDQRGSSAIRGRSRDQDLDHKTVLIDSFIAGASSGAIASLVTTPFDVGKTRQQTAARHAQSDGGGNASSLLKAAKRPEDMTMPRFLWHIFKHEGAAGLFKGWAARCMKVAPACAIMISSYEIGKKMAGGINQRRDGASNE